MIKVHLSKLMGEQRMNIQELSDKTGLHRNGISKLYNEKTTSISFESIEKICGVLNCDISDLLEIKKEDRA